MRRRGNADRDAFARVIGQRRLNTSQCRLLGECHADWKADGFRLHVVDTINADWRRGVDFAALQARFAADKRHDIKGVLGVQVPAGEHTVSVFPAAGGLPLVSKPLTVTDR